VTEDWALERVMQEILEANRIWLIYLFIV
jgi:hypothetical protein